MTSSNTTGNPTTDSSTLEDSSVNIMVKGNLARFEYSDLEKIHQGDSWFGCTVGFRAMQVAARELSGDTLWSRDSLSVISGHPGIGVRDAIEMITAAVSTNRFRLLENIDAQGCNREMKFEWWISNKEIDNDKTIHIKLHDDIVPEAFFTLLDRINSDAGHNSSTDNENRNKLNQLKKDLSELLWQQSLYASFDVDHVSTPAITSEVIK